MNSQEKLVLKTFERNSEVLNNREIELSDSTLSEVEAEVFLRGKLGKLATIRKDRLYTT